MQPARFAQEVVDYRLIISLNANAVKVTPTPRKPYAEFPLYAHPLGY
jgi:hypothetical protein